MLTAMEELNSKLNTVLNNQRVILRHLQVGACGPTTDNIPEGIILPLASMDQLDQLETHLLDPAVERRLVSLNGIYNHGIVGKLFGLPFSDESNASN